MLVELNPETSPNPLLLNIRAQNPSRKRDRATIQRPGVNRVGAPGIQALEFPGADEQFHDDRLHALSTPEISGSGRAGVGFFVLGPRV